jgi:hypothetical protein
MKKRSKLSDTPLITFTSLHSSHILQRLSDKQLWRRVEIFVHPTYITLTVVRVPHMARDTSTEFNRLSVKLDGAVSKYVQADGAGN